MKSTLVCFLVSIFVSSIGLAQNSRLDSLKLRSKTLVSSNTRILKFSAGLSGSLQGSGGRKVNGSGGGSRVTVLNYCDNGDYAPGNIKVLDATNNWIPSMILQNNCNLAFGFPLEQQQQSNNQGWDHFQFRELQTMHADLGGTHFAFNSYSKPPEQPGENWTYPRLSDDLHYPANLGSSQFVQFGDGAMGWYNADPTFTKGPTKVGIFLDNQQNFGVGLDNPQSKMHVNGDLTVGNMEAGEGSIIFLGGTNHGVGSENGDPVSIGRFNKELDHTALRIQVGDDGDELKDKVEIGFFSTTSSQWMPGVALYSSGEIYAKKVNVTLSSFPDYVFLPNYKLLPLRELENYIALHGHLPEVPSAEEVEKEGADLGELNKILLKKIEEMTLHLIRLEKEIEALKKTN